MSEEYRKRVTDAIFNQYRPYFKHEMGDGLAEKIAGYAARAAIEAMREPAPEMTHVGEGITDLILPEPFTNTQEDRQEEIVDAWRAMISTALGERPPIILKSIP